MKKNKSLKRIRKFQQYKKKFDKIEKKKITLKASNVLASSSRTRRFSSALSIELLLLSELIALETAADDLE